MTASARSSDSFRLSESSPRPSVCPTIVSGRIALVLISCAVSSRRAPARPDSLAERPVNSASACRRIFTWWGLDSTSLIFPSTRSYSSIGLPRCRAREAADGSAVPVTGMPVNSPAVPGVIAVTFATFCGIAVYSAAISRVAPGSKFSPLVEPVGR